MSYTELADRLSAFIIDDEFLNAVDEAIAILRSLDAQRPTVDEVMAQAQVFASAWALVGSRFVSGSGLEEAEQEKKDLCALVEALAAPVAAQPTSHAVIAGVLFDFAGWLTARKERLCLSSADDASPAVTAITDFAKMRNLSLDNAMVTNWQSGAAQPQQAKPLDEVEISGGIHDCKCGITSGQFPDIAFIRGVRWAEQRHGIKEQG